MENNNLEEKIRKNLKEEIAISNIRKEFDMKTKKNRKMVYILSTACAIFILCIGIGLGLRQNNNLTQITDETGKIKININKLNDLKMTSLDAAVQTTEINDLPENLRFMQNLNILENFTLEGSYAIYVKKSQESNEYSLLHDYVLEYRKDELNKIQIAFSEIGEPLRDYFIDEEGETSKIGDTELKIYQYNQTYMITFSYQNINFDIETTGINESQLIDLLKSIIK